MEKTTFWADTHGNRSTVRCGNEEVLTDCRSSEARAIARQLNDVLARAMQEQRPAEVLKKSIGKMSAAEKRAALITEYAVMRVLDHEN
jgi:hypothetical protein